MIIKALRRVSSSIQDIDILSRALQDWSAQLGTNPLLGGQLIQNVTLTTSTLNVPHSLGKPWTGYLITYKNAASPGIQATRDATTDSLTIKLSATATVTVDLWVF